MRQYEPPFDDPRVTEVARARGVLMADETMEGAIERLVRALVEAADANGYALTARMTERLTAALKAGRIAVSSQLLASAGRSGQSVAACTVLPRGDGDETERLRRTLAELATASESGMGCGIDVSDFADPAMALREINREAMRLNRSLKLRNLRPPAVMVTCAASHPASMDFAAAKQGADFGDWAVNISLMVGNDDPRWAALVDRAAELAHSNGEPGILFLGRAEDDNPTPGLALRSTAPCAEVFLAENERCVFTTVNVAAHVTQGRFDWIGFAESIRVATLLADTAVDLAADDAHHVVADRRRVGVGICGFHSALIRLGVPYAESVRFAWQLAEHLRFHAHVSSAVLAEKRGPFPLWESSRWRDIEWVRRKSALLGRSVSHEQWKQLAVRQATEGMRNASVVAFPPTGVVAELLGVSRSYEPHFTLVGRTGIAGTSSPQLVPEAAEYLDSSPSGKLLTAALLGQQHSNAGIAAASPLLACARELSASIHLDIHEAFSLLADDSGSKTVNLPHHASVEDVLAVFERARRSGLKGVTVFRDPNQKET